MKTKTFRSQHYSPTFLRANCVNKLIVPAKILLYTKNVANRTVVCKKCGKQFLVIDEEQKFLNEKNLPLPINCPSCRQLRRLMLRGGERTLYRTKCQKCGNDIVVAFNPEKTQNTILCKKDYEQYFTENDPIIKEPLPEI